MIKRLDAQERMTRSLTSLTKRLAESHLELSAACRNDKAILRELKTARLDHERWLRDHEVRLKSHYRSISDLKDRLR